MKEIARNPHKSKAWRVLRDTTTGDYLTGRWYYYDLKPELLQKQIDQDKAGVLTPNARSKPTPADLEILDYMPTVRGKLKFNSAHNGNSAVQVIFESATLGRYYLDGNHTNLFFRRVGEGKIPMDSAGYYEFDFTFVKKSDKVFISLTNLE